MSELAAIRTENLGKVFGRGRKSVAAVKNLTLEIDSGQVCGFLGPNGAGPGLTAEPSLAVSCALLAAWLVGLTALALGVFHRQDIAS